MRAWRPDEQAQALDRLDGLTVKSVEACGGCGIVFGSSATARDSRRRGGWITQPVVRS